VSAAGFSLYRLDRELSREQLIDELAATPERVPALVAGAPTEALDRRPTSDTWSPVEVCRHMPAAAQVYGMRFKWMILQNDPLLPNYEEDGWVANSPDGVDALPRMIDEMAAYRAETVRLLRALPPDGWSRSGRHEVLGALTLEPYVRHEVAHEESHVAQLRAALSDR